jgi:hypothetical protein
MVGEFIFIHINEYWDFLADAVFLTGYLFLNIKRLKDTCSKHLILDILRDQINIKQELQGLTL